MIMILLHVVLFVQSFKPTYLFVFGREFGFGSKVGNVFICLFKNFYFGLGLEFMRLNANRFKALPAILIPNN